MGMQPPLYHMYDTTVVLILPSTLLRLQALAIGKRLEMLAHGAGPSRRRNHLRHVKHLQPAAGKEGHKPALNRTTNSAISTTNTRSAAVWVSCLIQLLSDTIVV